MSKTTATKTLEQQAAELSKLRPIQSMQPGCWWLGDYEDADGSAVQLWSRVSIVAEGTLAGIGKVVHLYGRDTTGDAVDLCQRRNFSVESLTEAQAKRCGLAVPDADADATR